MIRIKILILLAAVALLSACAGQRQDTNLASRSAGSPLGFQAVESEPVVMSGQLEELSLQEWQANQPVPQPTYSKPKWKIPGFARRGAQNVSARSNISLL